MGFNSGFKVLTKLEFSQQIPEKCSDIKFNKKICPVGSDLFHAERRMDRHADGEKVRHDEASSRFS